MSLLENANKTDFSGVYEKEKNGDVLFIIRYTVDGKTSTRLVGKKSEHMTSYLAYKIKLENISARKLSVLNKSKGLKEDPFDFIYLFKEFYEYRKPFLAKNTNKNYKSHLSKYFILKFSNISVQSITKNDLQLYINSLLELKRPATVEKIVITLRQFFKYLIEKGILSYNPASSINLPKYDNKKYFSLQKKDVSRLVEYIVSLENKRDKALYAFLLHGRRVSECISIKVEDINLLTGFYKISAENSKTKKSLFWKLENFQIEWIKDYILSIKSSQVYLFENNETKKPITYTTAWRMHERLKSCLSMSEFTLHMFRHVIGFLLINKGYSLEIISKVLGHTNIISTQRYSFLKIDVASKAYSDTINEFWKPNSIKN